MEELISQISAILRGMWKFRWLGLIVAWVIGAGGMVAAFKVPDRYEAMARIFVDTQSILKPLMSGLAVQELTRLQATSEIQVAALKARVDEYSARHAQARALTRTSPQLEAEAAQLNRDYGIVKKSYEDLVGRRQSAVMSGDLDMASGVVDFRLIDPPRVSPRPVSPNRSALVLVALGVGVIAGLASAFAASQLRPVYNDSQTLRLKSGVPLLGVVSMVLSEEQGRRERFDRLRLQFGAAGFLAFFLVALLTVSILAARQLD